MSPRATSGAGAELAKWMAECFAAGLDRGDFFLFRGREWAGKLPIGKSESDQARRNELFHQFDPNGNGYLSLAEVDKGVHDILGLEVRGCWFWLGCLLGSRRLSSGAMLQDLFKCKPAIMRAFQAAKGAHTVIGSEHCFWVSVGYFASGRKSGNILPCLSDGVREEVAEATIT